MDFPIIQSRPKPYVHGQAGSFKALPSIYAIEATAACDLSCPMCLRTTDMVNKKPELLDVGLLELMRSRGDFEGSSYIELQQAGEPTIHPGLDNLIEFLQAEVGVMVGLSTHGLNMTKVKGKSTRTVGQTLLALDALTISVDSLDPEVYKQMRYPAKLEQLIEQLDYFFQLYEYKWACQEKVPFVELQLVSAPMVVEGSSGSLVAVQRLQDLMREKGWDKLASIRTTEDCFAEMRSKDNAAQGTQERSSSFCLNPWLSVSVSQTGDVLSCCYIFDPDKSKITYYGNLWENSLLEIWNSPRAQDMRAMQLAAANGHSMEHQCASCYSYSPALIHSNIVSRLVRTR